MPNAWITAIFLLVSMLIPGPVAAQNASIIPNVRDIEKMLPHVLSPQPLQPPERLVPWQEQPGGPPTSSFLPPEMPPKNLLELASKCLGDYDCVHKWLHPAYSTAFASLGCYCYSGRCRPTVTKSVPVSAEYPLGIAVWANRQWCPVPATALRRNNSKIPAILLQFDAHVCVSEHGCEELECVILGTEG